MRNESQESIEHANVPTETYELPQKINLIFALMGLAGHRKHGQAWLRGELQREGYHTVLGLTFGLRGGFFTDVFFVVPRFSFRDLEVVLSLRLLVCLDGRESTKWRELTVQPGRQQRASRSSLHRPRSPSVCLQTA